MKQVALNPGLRRDDGTLVHLARLRPITGADEASLDATDLRAATVLLGRLLAGGATLDPAELPGLVVTDVDRLLVAVYRMLFGDAVACRTACTSCGDTYELSFDIQSLAAVLDQRDLSVADGPDDSGAYRRGALRFRLPRLADLDVPEPLAPRLLVSGDPADPLLEASLRALAPVVAQTLPATCPQCGADQAPAFDLMAFLAAAMQRERPFLIREVHVLARGYGWSRAEILELSRDDRRQHVRLMEGERARTLRRAA